MKDSTSAALPSSPSAASVLFNLPDYRVVDVARDDDGDGHRTVRVVATATEGACPSCGVLTNRVHQRTAQRLRDVPFDGVVTDDVRDLVAGQVEQHRCRRGRRRQGSTRRVLHAGGPVGWMP